MAKRHKSNGKIKNNEKSFDSRLKSYLREFRFRTSDWLIITLGILAIECLLLIGNVSIWKTLLTTSSFESLFYLPPLPVSIVIVFCVVFIYKAILRRKISTYAIVIATLLSTIGFLFLFGLTPSEQRCSGLFGVMESCSETYRFQIYVLFLNPLSLMLESFLALTAAIALFVRGNQK